MRVSYIFEKKTRLACTRATSNKIYTVKSMVLESQLCSLSSDTLVFGNTLQKTYLVFDFCSTNYPAKVTIRDIPCQTASLILSTFFENCSRKRAYRMRVSTIASSKPWFLLCMFFSMLLTLTRYAHFFEKCCSLSCHMLIFKDLFF